MIQKKHVQCQCAAFWETRKDSFLLFSSTPLYSTRGQTSHSLLFSSTPLHSSPLHSTRVLGNQKPPTFLSPPHPRRWRGKTKAECSAGHSRRHHRTAIHDDSDGHHHREDRFVRNLSSGFFFDL